MTVEQFAAEHRVHLNDRKHERKNGLRASEATIHGRFGEIVADASFGDAFAVKFLAVPRSAVKKLAHSVTATVQPLRAASGSSVGTVAMRARLISNLPTPRKLS